MQSKRDEERKRNKSVTPFIKARNDREENREWEREGKGSGKSEDDQLPARPVRVSDLISEGKKKREKVWLGGRIKEVCVMSCSPRITSGALPDSHSQRENQAQ